MKFLNVSELVRLFRQKKNAKQAIVNDCPVSVLNTSTVPMQMGYMNVPPDHTLTFYNSLPSVGGALGGLFGNNVITMNTVLGGAANHTSLTNVYNHAYHGSVGAVSMSSRLANWAQSLPWIDSPPYISGFTTERELEKGYIWFNGKMYGVGYHIQFTKIIINGDPAEGKFQIEQLVLFEPYSHARLSDLIAGFVIRCDDGEFPLGASFHQKYKRMVCTLNADTALQEQYHMDSGDVMISPANGSFKLWET